MFAKTSDKFFESKGCLLSRDGVLVLLEPTLSVELVPMFENIDCVNERSIMMLLVDVSMLKKSDLVQRLNQ